MDVHWDPEEFPAPRPNPLCPVSTPELHSPVLTTPPQAAAVASVSLKLPTYRPDDPRLPPLGAALEVYSAASAVAYITSTSLLSTKASIVSSRIITPIALSYQSKRQSGCCLVCEHTIIQLSSGSTVRHKGHHQREYQISVCSELAVT